MSRPETIQDLVSHANRARSTGSTGVNEDSSRSHSIMQFALKREGEADGHPLGKISFIDLAGSERGADTYDNNRCSFYTLCRCHCSAQLAKGQQMWQSPLQCLAHVGLQTIMQVTAISCS